MKKNSLLENNHGYITATDNGNALMHGNKEGCQPKDIWVDKYSSGLIDKKFKSEKQMIYSTGEHWIILWAPALAILAFYISAINGVFTYKPRREILVYLMTSFFYTIMIITLLYNHWRAAEFAITNKRILMKTGQFKIKSFNTSLAKIKCIKVTQDPIGKIFNFGSIFIKDERGINRTFTFVSHPLEFIEKVQEQRDLIQSNEKELSIFN